MYESLRLRRESRCLEITKTPIAEAEPPTILMIALEISGASVYNYLTGKGPYRLEQESCITSRACSESAEKYCDGDLASVC